MSSPDRAQVATAPSAPEEPPVLVRAEHVTRRFALRRDLLGTALRRPVPTLLAVDDVSLVIGRRMTYGLVGESGSGKTTLGRMLIRLLPVSAGRIEFAGEEITELSGSRLVRLRRQMQIIFQDPYSSLNPRMTVRAALAEATSFHARRTPGPVGRDGRYVADRVAELLDLVGLARTLSDRYPHELSGGQRQRVGIARAIAVEPQFLVCDEPVSALDVSVRAQILNLLIDLQERLALTYLFIAHDLAIVRHLADTVGVMYMGRLVEEGPRRRIFEVPAHPYTQALLSAVPEIDPAHRQKRYVLEGEPGSVTERVNACNFATRCPFVMDICTRERPPQFPVAGGGWAACWLAASDGPASTPVHQEDPR